MSEANETVAEAIGESVGERVTEELQAATADATAAEETARQIAEGAMESERGQRVAGLEREVSEWRTKAEAQEQSISNLQRQVSELEGAVSTLVLAMPLQSTPTPQPEETPAVEVTTEAPVEVIAGDPADAPEVAEVAEVPAPKRKRARWI